MLLAAIFSSQLLIIKDIFDYSTSNGWIFGTISLLISNFVLLFLPAIRNYHYSGTGDVLSHIGYMNDIIKSAMLNNNPYPIDHAYGVTIYYITNIPPSEITMIIPPMFSIFFILSIFLIGRSLIHEKKCSLLFLLFGGILYFSGYNYLFAPNAQAMLVLPLVLYFIIKISQRKNLKENTILFLVISILITLFHPLIMAICISMFLIIGFFNIIQEKFLDVHPNKLPLLYIICLMLCLFTIWSTNFFLITNTIEPIVSSLTGVEDQISQFEKYSNTIGFVSVDYWYLTKLAISIHGQMLIISLLSIICIGIILMEYRKKLKKIPFFLQISIFEYLFFIILSATIFFISKGSLYIRISRVAMIFALIIIPYSIYIILKNKKLNDEKPITLIIIIACILFPIFSMTALSTYNLFDSPIIKESNQQVSENEYSGMKTFFVIRDYSMTHLEMGLNSVRFFEAAFGRNQLHPNLISGKMGETKPIDHFGYNTNTTLSQKYGDKYLVLNNRGIFNYQYVFQEFPQSWRFTSSDFTNLEKDRTVQKIYQNGGLYIFQIFT